MNKKDIYEHLANIYLDASLKSSKKKRKAWFSPKIKRGVIVAGLAVFLGVGSTVTLNQLNKHSYNSQLALFLHHDTAKINFNFDPAKKETFTLNLKQLNLSKYKSLAFGARKTNPQDVISLRVEFVNRFDEKSEIYIKDISSKWRNHQIDFSRFVKLNDWQQMKSLVFSVEEWNAREKSGIVYLDNIRVLQ
ncbi:MAG: hypothetical protein PHR84_06515 [Candidatus Omnitrophica bacterium]|nr:hypothetical protein [Candidatus Omnitrophota bacterium]